MPSFQDIAVSRKMRTQKIETVEPNVFVISGALEIILLQPSSITVYLNTQMRNRGAVLGPVPFQLMSKINYYSSG